MKFREALVKDDKAIKSNRVDIVARDLRTAYERCIEDIKQEIAKNEAAREDMLDMSSDYKDTINIDAFCATTFVNEDLRRAAKIRDLNDSLVLIKTRFDELF